MSPELMLRPSLSVRTTCYRSLDSVGVSPELMLRPSLSVLVHGTGDDAPACVAGAYAPAFVERWRMSRITTCSDTSVAGAYAPAFVERCGFADTAVQFG